ncbi:hypothetical protein Tco_0026590 [Tanacetum coccineum]
MNDPNITMEEYIRLEEEKAQSRSETFNWKTGTFGRIRNYYEEERFMNFEEEFPAIVFRKIKEDGNGNMPTPPKPTVDYFDDLDYFKDFENEFPAIVYNDGLMSKSDLGTKPLVISECINEFNLIDETSLSKYDEEIVSRFNNLFNDIHHDDLKSEKDDEDDDINMAPLPAADQRHPWLKYEVKGYTLGIVHSCDQRLETIWSRPVNRDHVLDFEGLAPEMRQDLAVRLRMAPEKVTGVDLFYLRSIEHGTTNVPHLLAQYMFRHAEGRKSGARLSGGHFIRRLAMHFRLVSDEGLRGLHVVTRELPLIDLHELRRLNICMRYGDTWAWVAQGLVRQQVAAAGAHEANEARPTAKEVAPKIPVPVPAPAQAPPQLPPAPQPRTMSQRIERLEEEVHDLRRDVVGLRGDVSSFTTEQSRVSNSTWLIYCMTQLMDASGQTY